MLEKFKLSSLAMASPELLFFEYKNDKKLVFYVFDKKMFSENRFIRVSESSSEENEYYITPVILNTKPLVFFQQYDSYNFDFSESLFVISHLVDTINFELPVLRFCSAKYPFKSELKPMEREFSEQIFKELTPLIEMKSDILNWNSEDSLQLKLHHLSKSIYLDQN